MNNRFYQTLSLIGVVGGLGIAIYIGIASATGPNSPSTESLALAVGTGGVLIAFLSYSANSTARSIDRLEKRLDRRIDDLKDFINTRIDDLGNRIDDIT